MLINTFFFIIAAHVHAVTHTCVYHWIWYFGEIFQARGFREEVFNHIIVACHLFLQQALCKTWEKSNVD